MPNKNLILTLSLVRQGMAAEAATLISKNIRDNGSLTAHWNLYIQFLDTYFRKATLMSEADRVTIFLADTFLLNEHLYREIDALIDGYFHVFSSEAQRRKLIDRIQEHLDTYPNSRLVNHVDPTSARVFPLLTEVSKVKILRSYLLLNQQYSIFGEFKKDYNTKLKEYKSMVPPAAFVDDVESMLKLSLESTQHFKDPRNQKILPIPMLQM